MALSRYRGLAGACLTKRRSSRSERTRVTFFTGAGLGDTALHPAPNQETRDGKNKNDCNRRNDRINLLLQRAHLL